MKPHRLTQIAISALLIGACQPTLQSNKDAGSGEAGTTGGGAGTSAAGTTGSPGGAGTTAAGGTGGSTAIAGTTGSAAGTSGAGTSGGGAGTSGAGTSGSDAAAGTTATAGTAGGAGTTATGETVNDIFGLPSPQYPNDKLADSFFLWPCYSNQNQDCISIPAGTTCPTPDPKGNFEEQGLVINETYKVGGVPGKMYMATIQVNGVSEGKYYEKGVRAAGETDPPNAQSDKGTDTWYTGGNAIYFEYYNVYSMRVYDTAMKELQHYYLNSFPKTGNVQYEDHWTFAISYTHSFPVMGGGTIVYHSSDINCHAIDNCGSATTSQTCPLNQARMVPNEPNLLIPTTYMGKQTSTLNYRTHATQPWHAHIIHIKFTAVTPM